MNEARRCVVLVPVGSHIEPTCEASLQALERRGYPVWRVRGYSAIDQGRNQMATDALMQDFAETMWIDSDIAFRPDDVDRLRAHGRPIACALYPKKGKRELAAHVIPGTEKLLFGQDGGLAEICYAGAGFLHVQREVYENMQRQLALPICNWQFERPVVPYFLPLIREPDAAPWYLGEDYAFCERARQCGYRIVADTTIRLGHIGSYEYTWEDAGADPRRYANYTYHLNASASVEKAAALPDPPALAALRAQYSWPSSRPAVLPRPHHGWLSQPTQRMLESVVGRQTRLVLELGAWLGLTTRFLAGRAPRATIVAIDHWQGGPEHRDQPEYAALLPALYETFLANCWSLRERVIALRSDTLSALQRLRELQIEPDVVYIDADHSFEAVRADLLAALDAFPRAAIVGDDWDWETVARAVTDVADERRLHIEQNGVAWRIIR